MMKPENHDMLLLAVYAGLAFLCVLCLPHVKNYSAGAATPMHAFEPGDCIASPDRESWEKQQVYFIKKVGKAHYLAKDCDSSFKFSMSFLDDSRYEKIECPKTCRRWEIL